jgi:hypothetical protein
MTYMRSWKSHRLTSHIWLWLGLNPQVGRPLSRIVGTIGLFFLCQMALTRIFSTIREIRVTLPLVLKFPYI